MIRSVKIIIYGGYCDIVHDDVFSLTGDGEYLEYEKNGVWYIESNPSGKGGNTIISVPRNFEFSSFILKASGCAAKVSAIQSKKAFFDIVSSVLEVDEISGEKIGISMSRGSAVINGVSGDEINIDCGLGSVDLKISKSDREYSMLSKRGMGKIIVNSCELPRNYEKQGGNSIINIVCGMGTVNINT